ncbi:hypothetical protein K1719_009515 [Acacia pycnantha]|nr:hypothetical protein K1719_009515 [Acacia pycnantha]
MGEPRSSGFFTATRTEAESDENGGLSFCYDQYEHGYFKTREERDIFPINFVFALCKDPSDVEAEQKQLEQAIKNSRERDKRTLLRAMNKGTSKISGKTPIDDKVSKVGQLFPNASLEHYARQNRHDGGHVGGETCDNEDDNSENEDCDDQVGDSENEKCNDKDGDSDNEDCEEISRRVLVCALEENLVLQKKYMGSHFAGAMVPLYHYHHGMEEPTGNLAEQFAMSSDQGTADYKRKHVK